jgi:hypothetical protein
VLADGAIGVAPPALSSYTYHLPTAMPWATVWSRLRALGFAYRSLNRDTAGRSASFGFWTWLVRLEFFDVRTADDGLAGKDKRLEPAAPDQFGNRLTAYPTHSGCLGLRNPRRWIDALRHNYLDMIRTTLIALFGF